jgi:hypothetical protein
LLVTLSRRAPGMKAHGAGGALQYVSRPRQDLQGGCIVEMVIPSKRLPMRSRVPEADSQEPEVIVGWLPIDLGGSLPSVRWMHVGSDPLSRPFFRETVNALRLSHPAPREYETGAWELERRTAGYPAVFPSGVIFHMTRCGSTLLANALRASSGAIVLSEAAPFERTMSWASSPSRHWAGIAEGLLTPLTTAVAHYLGPSAGKVVLKCGNVGIRALRALRRVWPRVPFLILIRDPIEVIVSNVNKRPRWIRECLDAADSRSRIFDPPAEVLASDVTELCAWGVGSFCSDALAAIDDQCAVLDYSALSEQAVAGVGAYFGLAITDEGRLRLHDAFLNDAKRPTEAFKSDSEAKRLSASEATRASARKWVEEPYEELRRRACSSSPFDGGANAYGFPDAR